MSRVSRSGIEIQPSRELPLRFHSLHVSSLFLVTPQYWVWGNLGRERGHGVRNMDSENRKGNPVFQFLISDRRLPAFAACLDTGAADFYVMR